MMGIYIQCRYMGTNNIVGINLCMYEEVDSWSVIQLTAQRVKIGFVLYTYCHCMWSYRVHSHRILMTKPHTK